MLGLFRATKTDNATQKPLAVSMGEPAGIGMECLYKAWLQRSTLKLPPFFVIADPTNMQQQANALGMDIKIGVIGDAEEASALFADRLPVIPLALKKPVSFGKPHPENATLVLESIKQGVEYVQNNIASALVTLPIHKSTLYQSGFHFAGHTEYLASLCNTQKSTVMMLEIPELRVALSTVHLSLKEAINSINASHITAQARVVERALRDMFGIDKPRIAVAALNPHAGEGGAMGLEEIEILEPAIENLRERGMAISGPRPADTLFHKAARASYDCALCLYHDQGLIPIKTLDFYGGVNITLGLPIVRTSPDHGTAFDIAGLNRANPESLIRAIKRAAELAAMRAQNALAA